VSVLNTIKNKGKVTHCVVPENIHTPPWRIIGNSKEEGSLKGENF